MEQRRGVGGRGRRDRVRERRGEGDSGEKWREMEMADFALSQSLFSPQRFPSIRPADSRTPSM